MLSKKKISPFQSQKYLLNLKKIHNHAQKVSLPGTKICGQSKMNH